MYEHVKERALERFGFVISDEELQELVCIVQQNKAKFIKRKSKYVTVFECELHNQRVWIVYNRRNKQIMTMLYGH